MIDVAIIFALVAYLVAMSITAGALRALHKWHERIFKLKHTTRDDVFIWVLALLWPFTALLFGLVFVDLKAEDAMTKFVAPPQQPIEKPEPVEENKWTPPRADEIEHL